MKIYYITRTYSQESMGNCSDIRSMSVNILRKRYSVVVVTPNYNSNETIINDDIISVPFRISKSLFLGEAIGLLED